MGWYFYTRYFSSAKTQKKSKKVTFDNRYEVQKQGVYRWEFLISQYCLESKPDCFSKGLAVVFQYVIMMTSLKNVFYF